MNYLVKNEVDRLMKDHWLVTVWKDESELDEKVQISLDWNYWEV